MKSILIILSFITLSQAIGKDSEIEVGDRVIYHGSSIRNWKVTRVQPKYRVDHFPFKPTFHTAYFLEQEMPKGSKKKPVTTVSIYGGLEKVESEESSVPSQEKSVSSKETKNASPKRTARKTGERTEIKAGDRVLAHGNSIVIWKVNRVQPNVRADHFPFKPSYHTGYYLEEELPEGSKKKPATTVNLYGGLEKLVDAYEGKKGSVSPGQSVEVDGARRKVKAVSERGTIVLSDHRGWGDRQLIPAGEYSLDCAIEKLARK